MDVNDGVKPGGAEPVEIKGVSGGSYSKVGASDGEIDRENLQMLEAAALACRRRSGSAIIVLMLDPRTKEMFTWGGGRPPVVLTLVNVLKRILPDLEADARKHYEDTLSGGRGEGGRKEGLDAGSGAGGET